jgi:hypothetical protein
MRPNGIATLRLPADASGWTIFDPSATEEGLERHKERSITLCHRELEHETAPRRTIPVSAFGLAGEAALAGDEPTERESDTSPGTTKGLEDIGGGDGI